MVGYKKCAAPNCMSKIGEGKTFKRFPKSENLASKWLAQLPPDFKVLPSTAICENHFDLEQFEPLRSDGSKKLKSQAVPTVFHKEGQDTPKRPAQRLILVKKAPLCDITNLGVQTPRQPCIVQRSQVIRTIQQDELDAAQLLLNISGQELEPKVIRAEQDPIGAHSTLVSSSLCSPVTSVPAECDPIHSTPVSSSLCSPVTSVPAECDPIYSTPVSSSLCSPVTSVPAECDPIHSTPVSSSLCSPVTSVPAECDPIYSTPVSSSLCSPVISVPAECDLESIVTNGFLNEVTGNFTPSPFSQSDSFSCITSPTVTPIIDLNLPIDEFLAREDLTLPVAIQYILAQQKLLDRIHDICSEQTERIESFKEQMEMKGKFELKYLALRKKHGRLEARYKRNTYSPYLTPNQFKRLFRRSNKGLEWTSTEIRQGLILKMKAGTSGYDAFAKAFHIIPSVRILQSKVQFIKFKPGLLNEVFDLIHLFAKDLKNNEKDCQMVMDEMHLKNFSKYDHVLDRYIGQCTLPGHTGTANKALLVVLAGISKRWKISVAVEFTNKKDAQEWRNTTGEAYGNLLKSVAKKAEEAGVRVCGITTDMGADNIAYWNHFGVTGSKYAKLVHTVPNPVRQDDPMFILPDIVHLFKNAKKMLENNKFIKLPQSIVEEEGLESPIVHYCHLDEAVEFEKDAELKVAFRLTNDNLHCQKHFSTMNVGTAKAVICQRSSAILKVMSEEKKNRSYLTTAYFIELLNAFFDLATCRHIGLAITKTKPAAYQKAIDLIKKVSFIFCNMEVGEEAEWKPVQRGFKILCASYLGLIDYFLEKRNYNHLMLGRFSSDCIENVFSLVRLLQAVPDAATFLQNLKVITLAQFSEAVRGASYDYDECEPIEQFDFLEEARQRAAERNAANNIASEEELMKYPFVRPTLRDFNRLGLLEKKVVYDMAGSVVKAVKDNRKICQNCLKSVKFQRSPDAVVHPMAEVSIFKEYSVLRTGDEEAQSKRLLQIYVSDTIFQAILTAEIAFRLNRANAMKFQAASVKRFFVTNLMYIWEDCDVLNCHNICFKLLSAFIGQRLKQYGKILRDEEKENKQPQFGSKSVTGHQLAANVGKRKRVSGTNAKTKEADPITAKRRKVLSVVRRQEKSIPVGQREEKSGPSS